MVDVLRDMGHSPVDRKVSWEVGRRVRDEHVALLERPPEYALRRKTNDTGKHCLAVYPAIWWARIEQIVSAVVKAGS